MRVKVMKAIDSESLGRIVMPGEIVDLPIDPQEHAILFELGIVTQDLSAKVGTAPDKEPEE